MQGTDLLKSSLTAVATLVVMPTQTYKTTVGRNLIVKVNFNIYSTTPHVVCNIRLYVDSVNVQTINTSWDDANVNHLNEIYFLYIPSDNNSHTFRVDATTASAYLVYYNSGYTFSSIQEISP